MSNKRGTGSNNRRGGNRNGGSGGNHSKNVNRYINIDATKSQQGQTFSYNNQMDIENQLASPQAYLFLQQQQQAQQELKKQQIMDELQLEIYKGEREELLRKVEALACESAENWQLYQDYLTSYKRDQESMFLASLDIMKK